MISHKRPASGAVASSGSRNRTCFSSSKGRLMRLDTPDGRAHYPRYALLADKPSPGPHCTRSGEYMVGSWFT